MVNGRIQTKHPFLKKGKNTKVNIQDLWFQVDYINEHFMPSIISNKERIFWGGGGIRTERGYLACQNISE